MSIQAILSQLDHFSSLPSPVRDALAAVAYPVHYEPGSIIYLEGDTPRHVYILEKGWVKACKMTREGREQGLMFMRPVELFGDVAVFNGSAYPATTTALEAVDAWAIPAERYLDCVKAHPDLGLVVIRKMSARILYYIGLVEDLALKSVEARLASTLLQHAQLVNDQIEIPRRDWTTYDEIALRLGTVRDVLSRAMKTLESEGYLRVEKQRIVILDPIGLTERAKR